MEVLLLWLGILAVIGLIPAAIASSKGRDFVTWWLYGMALWIVALIHSLVLQPTGAALDNKAIAAGNLKCPHCAEWIKREAKVCRFCSRDVENVPAPAAAPVVWPYPFPPPSDADFEISDDEDGDADDGEDGGDAPPGGPKP